MQTGRDRRRVRDVARAFQVVIAQRDQAIEARAVAEARIASMDKRIESLEAIKCENDALMADLLAEFERHERRGAATKGTRHLPTSTSAAHGAEIGAPLQLLDEDMGGPGHVTPRAAHVAGAQDQAQAMQVEAMESLARVTASAAASAATEIGLREKHAGSIQGETVAIAPEHVEGVRNLAQATLLAALSSADKLDLEDKDLIQWSATNQDEITTGGATKESEKRRESGTDTTAKEISEHHSSICSSTPPSDVQPTSTVLAEERELEPSHAKTWT